MDRGINCFITWLLMVLILKGGQKKSDPSRDHKLCYIDRFSVELSFSSLEFSFMELLSGVVYCLFTVLNTVIKGRALASPQIATQIQK